MNLRQTITSITTILLIALTPITAALKTTYTSVTLQQSATSLRAGDSLLVGLELTHRKGWHSYWSNPGDSGIATTIKWDVPAGFEMGEIVWDAPKRHSLGPLVNFGYADNVTLLIPVNIQDNLKNGSYVLNGTASWLVCDEICVPESLTFSLPITLDDNTVYTDDKNALEQMLKQRQWPVLQGALMEEGSFMQIRVPLQEPLLGTGLYVYPYELNVLDYQEEQAIEITENEIVMRLPRVSGETAAIGKITGLLELSTGKYVRIEADGPGGKIGTVWGILWMCALAFLGGIILNVMPCVFPILSLKVMAILEKSKKEQDEIRRQALGYTAGVWVMFMILVAVLGVLKYMGLQLGWGFQLQEPVFILGLFIVMMGVGLHFNNKLGLPQWLNMLPGSLSGLHQRSTRKGAYRDFFTGVLAVLIATPCTAPFMAVAIGFALTQSLPVMGLVFTVLALGFAAPFLLIAYVPLLQRALPRPGAWMETVKQVLAIPLYVTGLWLAWILSQQLGLVAWVTCGVCTVLLFALGMSQSLGVKRLLAIMLIAMVVGIAFLNKADALDNQAVFAEMEELLAQKKAFFVDVTADWCLSCKVNERLVLLTPEIQAFFKENDIAFLTLDWTQSDSAITRYLESFDRQGVPLYVYYNKAGDTQVLPEILSKSMIFNLIDEEQKHE